MGGKGGVSKADSLCIPGTGDARDEVVAWRNNKHYGELEATGRKHCRKERVNGELTSHHGFS